MRLLAFSVLLLATACVGTMQPGPQPIDPTVKFDVTINGEIDVSSITVLGFPYTYPVKAWGNGTVFFQYPMRPHVSFEGDGGWTIEPITPQDRAYVESLVASGELALPPNTSLSAPGTILSLQQGGSR